MTKDDNLLDEIYGLQCDIGRLEQENNKLREELEAVGMTAYLYGRDDLKDENAKLREVASLMAAHYLPNSLRMSPKKWRERDRLIREMLGDLKIEVRE